MRMNSVLDGSTPEQGFNPVGYFIAVNDFLGTVSGPNGISFSGLSGDFGPQLVGLFDEHELIEMEARDAVAERHPEWSARAKDAAMTLAGHASRASAIIEVLGTEASASFDRMGMLDDSSRATIVGIFVEIAQPNE